MRDPDAALIDASRNGDRAAFARIVERYQRAVYAVSFSGVRDRALSDDLTQDTFVAAWRRLGELRDTTRLPAWLCGIARNLARDACKRRHREQLGETEDVADPTTPFDALSDAESERLVAAALAGVRDVYREALVLFYYEQQSIDEVARALGITAHTTNKRLSRGRQQLAARVDALLESRLTTRGPKRDLAACVVAAIVVLAPAHAEAAPLLKGFTMPKLALATVLVATVGGVGLIAARPTSPPRSTPAPAPAVAPTTQQRASVPVAPQLPRAVRPRVVPTCEAAATHMAELQIDALDGDHRLPAQKRDQVIALRARDLARHCASEHWPDERRLCVMSADDSDSARVDCVDGIVATADELVGMPRELGCELIAKHAAELMSAPDGKLAAIARKTSSDVQQLASQWSDQETAECERIPWSRAVRRCMVASKTAQDLGHCM